MPGETVYTITLGQVSTQEMLNELEQRGVLKDEPGYRCSGCGAHSIRNEWHFQHGEGLQRIWRLVTEWHEVIEGGS